MKNRIGLGEAVLSVLQLLGSLCLSFVFFVWEPKDRGLFLYVVMAVAVVLAGGAVVRSVRWLARRFRKQS